MELGRYRSRPIPPGNSATNAARIRVRKSRGGLGDLGFAPGSGPGHWVVNFNNPYVQGNVWVPDPSTTLTSQQQFDAALSSGLPSQRAAQIAAMASRGITPSTFGDTKAGQQGDLTAKARAVANGVDPQIFVKHNLDKTFFDKVVTVVGNNAPYVAMLAAGGLAASGLLAAGAANTVAASSLAPEVTAGAIMPGAEAVASGATGGLLTTGATATALTASGVASGLKTVKDIYGVANTIRALMRKPMGGAPLPTLDSSYGNGGFSAPLTQSAPSFFQGNNLLWLGGGIIAVLATVVLMQSKKRGKA